MQIPESIRNSIEAIRLPSVPQVLLRFLDMVEDDRASLSELAALVGRDPSLSARFLAVANSPELRRDRRMANLADCLTTLGTRLARTIAECLLIEGDLTGADGEARYDVGIIWRHSLRVAETARALAAKTGYPDCEEAYLAGLLHDIGQLLLLGGRTEHYGDWLQNIGNEAKLRDIEELLYHTDHAAIGAWLVDQWQLSSFLSDAILFHHRTHQEILDADPLSRIIWSAHVIDSMDEQAGLCEEQPQLATVASLFGLDLSELSVLRRESTGKVAVVAGALGVPEGVGGDRESRQSLDEEGSAGGEVEVRVRDMAIMHSLQRNLPSLCREEEILSAVRESARILFGVGRLAFLFCDPQQPVLATPDLAGQPGVLRQLQIRLDTGRSLAAAALLDRQPRSTFDEDSAVAVSLVDVQVARALGSEGVLYVPLSLPEGEIGVMAYGVTASQHGRLAKLLPRVTRFARQAAVSIEAWRDMRAKEERIALNLTGRFHQHARKVVHEAGNPLGIMKNYLKILGQKLPDEHAGEELDILREEVDRVAQILQRLGDLSEAPPPAQMVDINGMINGMLALYGESLFSSQGIAVEKELAPSLLPITGDRDSIKQILLNLWTNAADALQSGDRFVISTADNVILNGRFYVEICLSDSGPGLPPDIMQRLFQPLDTPRRAGHAGLGLSIVASLVDSLDGLIKCRSNAGTGTSFVILLPKANGSEAGLQNV